MRRERRMLEMSACGTELLDEILTLPPQERAQLAERILDSLSQHASDPTDVCGRCGGSTR